MASLKDFSTLDISWDLTPEHAVTMYLEWGNNDWHSEYPPVRSKDDMSNYFVVDTWRISSPWPCPQSCALTLRRRTAGSGASALRRGRSRNGSGTRCSASQAYRTETNDGVHSLSVRSGRRFSVI